MRLVIIFLDFDGPLFPEKVFVFEENNGVSPVCKELDLHPYANYWKADPFMVSFLNNLYNLEYYEFVISSSWADDYLGHKRENLEDLLYKNGLKATIHEDWRTPRDIHERENQIASWINKNKSQMNRYIILDDVYSGDGLSDEKNGVKLEDYEKMKSVFSNKNKYKL